MMALCENQNKKRYEFLCHGESDGPRSHQLDVKINGSPLPDASKFKEFWFHVKNKETGNPAATNPIGAYNPADSDDNAFSHIVDIERVYGKTLNKRNPPIWQNRITVSNGVIHTSRLSDFEFSLVDTNGTEMMAPRQIVVELSINISLADNEVGVLSWYNDSAEVFDQEFDNNSSHKIIFNNDCTDTSRHDLKCVDSDFPLNFDNIIEDSSILRCDLRKFINTMAGEEAPCTTTGFGGSGLGWEPPPPIPD